MSCGCNGLGDGFRLPDWGKQDHQSTLRRDLRLFLKQAHLLGSAIDHFQAHRMGSLSCSNMSAVRPIAEWKSAAPRRELGSAIYAASITS